jgi:hypothetical protein
VLDGQILRIDMIGQKRKKERKKTEGQVLRYQLIDFIYAESTLITSAQFSQHLADHLYFTVRTLDADINVILVGYKF